MKVKNIIWVLVSSLFFSMTVVHGAESITIESKEKVIDIEKGLNFDIITSLNDDIIDGSFDIITSSNAIEFDSINLDDRFETSISGTKVTFTLKKGIKASKMRNKLGSVSLKTTERAKTGDEVTIIINNMILNTKEKNHTMPTTSQKFKIGKVSSNAKLKGLYSSLAKIDFQPNKYTYQVEVAENIDEFDLQAKAEDEKAIVTISNQKLDSNVTTIKVIVTNGEEKKEYKVVVNKRQIENKEAVKVQDVNAIKKPWILIVAITFVLMIISIGYIQYKNR